MNDTFFTMMLMELLSGLRVSYVLWVATCAT